MDYRINQRKNKTKTVAWPGRRGSPRRRGATHRRSKNFSGGVLGLPRRKDLRLGGALRIGMHSYA